MLNELIPKMLSNTVLSLTFVLLILHLQGQRWQWGCAEHQFTSPSPSFLQPLFKNLLRVWPAGTRIPASAEVYRNTIIFRLAEVSVLEFPNTSTQEIKWENHN